MIPTFTVMIGSAGRETLEETLESMKHQMIEGDQVIVSFDSFERGPTWTCDQIERVTRFGRGFWPTYYDAGYHEFGVEQINYAWKNKPILGSHITTIGDDDVFVDGAFDNIRTVCRNQPDRVIFYRFIAPPSIGRPLLWDKPRFKPCHISGCCIMAPRQFVGLHPTGQGAVHDVGWMQDIMTKAPTKPVWMDYVGVVARPDKAVGREAIWTCAHCNAFGPYRPQAGNHQRCAICGKPIERTWRIVPEVAAEA